jgi:hypothetical protein
VLARLQALREARKGKEAQELEQQHILTGASQTPKRPCVVAGAQALTVVLLADPFPPAESASRVKFKGGAGTRTDMNAVLDRIRARAGAVLPAAPPDESMIVDAGAVRGTHVVVPDDLGDLEALIIGGPQDAPGDATADAGAGELVVLPQTGGEEGEVEEEEDGTGGMRLFGRAPPAGLLLRMDDTQGDGDELAAMEEEEDPMAGEAAEAAAAEDALVSETESDTDEEEEDGDGDDVAPDADGDELPPPPQEALLTEEERVAQRAAVRAAAMQFLEEEKALRAAERSKAKAAAAAAAAGTGEKLGWMEDEAEMSEDGGHTDDDDASDTDDDLAELEAMLAAAEEGGDAEAADAIRAKIHADWEQAADDRAVAGVVRAMQTGWRRRRGRRLRGEDGDLDDDDPRGPRRRRRGEAGGEGDGGDDDVDVRNPFLQTGDGMFDDDPMTQAHLRGPPAVGRGAPAPGSFMSLLAADDPSRAVLGLLRRRPMAPPPSKPSSGDAMDARGGGAGGSFFSRGGLPEGASLPQLPPRRGPDGGSSRAFVFARGDDSQGPRDPAGDAGHTDTPQVGVRGAKAAARAAMAAAATAKTGGALRPTASAGGTSLLGMLRSYSQSDSQATGDVGENLASNLRKAQGIRMD